VNVTDPEQFSENNHAGAAGLDGWLDEQQAQVSGRRPAGVSPAIGELAAELLELAAASNPDPEFAAALERRLRAATISSTPATRPLSTGITKTIRRQTMSRRWLFASAAIAVLVLALLFGSALWNGNGGRPVAAAELWQQANEALVADAGGAPFVYDRLQLSWQSSGSAYEDIVAELWQSADGAQWRYQLTDAAGNILYFLQQSGGEVWQSIHPQPVGSAPLTELFVQPAGEPVALPEGALLHQDVATGWLDLNRLLAERTAACIDLYCLLGIDAASGSLSSVEETTGETGEPVYRIEVSLPADFSRTLVLDRETGRLQAVEDRDRGQLIARLEHVERRGLATDELGEGFFASAPAGLALVQSSPQEGADRVWIVSVSPEPGSVVTTTTRFEVVIGYELASLPKAQIDVALARPDFRPGPGGRLPVERGGQVEVDAAGDEATITFTLGPDELQWLGEDRVEMALWVLMGHFSGVQQISTVAGELFTDYAWTFEP
jgi:hypothetical protein